MARARRDEVLTAEEAAEYLRMALSTLYRYMREGRVPCFKVGSRWRFKRSVLDEWIEQVSVVDAGWSAEEIDREATMKKREEREHATLDVGLGGIFKGLGTLLELASKLDQEGATEARREGEIGPLGGKGFKAVYGISVKLGGEGRPTIEQFGNVREDEHKGPVVDEVREPIVDRFDEGDYLLLVAEMPGVDEADIEYQVEGDILILSAETGDKKYHKEVLLSTPVDTEKSSSSYKNGIFELKLWKAQPQ